MGAIPGPEAGHTCAIPEYPRDTRGEGEIIEGAKIRKYLGSTMPPGIPPVTWKKMTHQTKKDAIEEHLTNLGALQDAYREQFEEGHAERLR